MGQFSAIAKTSVAVAGLCCGLAVSAANAGSGTGQVIMQNRTSQTQDLWVDGHLGCTALAHLDCSSTESAGGHTLTIQQGQTVELTQPFTLADGGTYTYTVSESTE